MASMVRITGEITINRPIDEVFDFVADATNEPLYNPMMLRAEKITDGPVGLGTRFRDETTSMGRHVEIFIEVTGYKRPHRIAEAISLPATNIRGTLTFDLVPDGTRMRWSWDVEPHGVLKLMTPVIAWRGRRQEETIWAGLKQHLEGPAASVPAASSPREIAPGVYWLPIRGSNVYFVRSDLTWAVIDTAWGKSARSIQQAAEALFGASARPAGILLTHAHPDHTGAAHDLARHWDCPVYLHPDELPFAVAGDLPTLVQCANPLDRWVVLPLMRALPRRKAEAILAKGSLIDVAHALDLDQSVPGLPDWRWVPTPGHSPGHVAYFRESDRVLITGDAVLTVDLNSVRGWLLWGLRHNRPRVSGSPWYTNWDARATRESVRSLAGFEPQVLASGHGTPMIGPQTAGALRTFATDPLSMSTGAHDDSKRDVAI